MTTLKTPKQIAADILDGHCIQLHWRRTGAQLADLIAEAIEADRAQRAADLQLLADAASKWATELTDYIIPSAENQDEPAEVVSAYEDERDEIQAALGRYLAEEEATR